ncbi:MAG: translation initiation factor IF-2 [Bryobacteraceae bacterium]
MKKIRINELAREMEVKAHLILEMLPSLGVAEKKTHSSSIDEDVAVKLRKHFGVEGEPSSGEMERNGDAAHPEVKEVPDYRAKREDTAEVAPESSGERRETPVEEPPAAPGPVEERNEEPVLSFRPAAQPIRPPLAATQQGERPESRAPEPRPAQTPPPARSPVPSSQRPVAMPAKPLPTAPRPGQVLSGPRQPFPAGSGEGLRPAQVVAPGPPRTSAPPPQRPQASAPAAPAGPAPGKPIAPRPTLAGQPAPRPVVPPRQDLAQRLAQPRIVPNQQQGGRMGVPLRPQQVTPIPGKPIYQPPPRPGAPQARQGARPGAPASRPGGPRPMHPTTRGRMDAPAVPPPPGDQRRVPDKRTGRPEQRGRREHEERNLRPSVRRDQPAAPPPITRDITISEGITVKELSEKLDVKASLVIKKLVDRNIFATINQTLDSKLATELSREFGASTSTLTYEEEAMAHIEVAEEEKDQIRRPPVVTIMGHVDHGKTSLLDVIRTANVAEKEAGGITQHIGAYHVELNNRKIVFIDTPGHEAFTRMRSRGAKVTDVVVLVVAADDGVMPQTLEAIDHARAAKVPIIVAINKIDKGDAQPDRVKQQLSDRGLLAEDWGGDTVMVPVSARQRTNIDLLLEMILLVADLQDLKANPGRPAMGSVLESQLDRGRGPVATVLVGNGTLRVGDFFICGSVFGRVRAMLDDRGEQVREAAPSMPVEVLGLDSLPDAGDSFQVVTDTAKAKQIVMFREAKLRDQALAKNKRLTLEQLHKQMAAGEVKELFIILKTDVAGSAEVISDTLQKLSNDKVRIRVLHSGVGAITESDVLLAVTSNAIVIGFNVRPERGAAQVAEQEKVEIRLHTIIYNLTDEIKKAMTGMLEPVYREIYKGKAEIRDTFRVTKVGMVAGCVVQDGLITRDSEVRLLRDNVVVHTGKVGSLRRFKDDVSEVKSGMECGITLGNYSDFKPGDVIEAFVTERVAEKGFV